MFGGYWWPEWPGVTCPDHYHGLTEWLGMASEEFPGVLHRRLLQVLFSERCKLLDTNSSELRQRSQFHSFLAAIGFLAVDNVNDAFLLLCEEQEEQYPEFRQEMAYFRQTWSEGGMLLRWNVRNLGNRTNNMIELLLKRFLEYHSPMFEAWKVPKRRVELSCDVTQHLSAYRTAVGNRTNSSCTGRARFCAAIKIHDTKES